MFASVYVLRSMFIISSSTNREQTFSNFHIFFFHLNSLSLYQVISFFHLYGKMISRFNQKITRFFLRFYSRLTIDLILSNIALILSDPGFLTKNRGFEENIFKYLLITHHKLLEMELV